MGCRISARVRFMGVKLFEGLVYFQSNSIPGTYIRRTGRQHTDCCGDTALASEPHFKAVTPVGAGSYLRRLDPVTSTAGCSSSNINRTRGWF